MEPLLQLVHRFHRALERSDEAALAELLADDVVQREFPNRLVPAGATRDKKALLEGLQRGKAILRAQTFEITNAVVSGATVAYEATWTGTLAIALGTKQPGDTMRARFGVFVTFREGKIISQHNYDCFDAF